MTPAISFCVPVYQAERTIERCIDSIVRQPDYQPDRVEVVLVDDCSTDRTKAILERYRGRAGFRVVFNETNLGLTRNWDRALSFGTGDVVSLLHGDDWLLPGCTDAAIRLFRENERIVFAAFRQLHAFEDGTTENRNTDHDVGAFSASEYVVRRLQFRDCPAPSTAFFRRSSLAGLAPLYDPAFYWCPELDLYVRLAIHRPHGLFVHDDRVMVMRGASRGQFSSRYPGYNVLDTCTALERHIGRLSREQRADARRHARRSISENLLSVLYMRDAAQLLRILRSPVFRRWLLSNPRNGPVVAARIAVRAVRKLRLMASSVGVGSGAAGRFFR